jgi:branched-chain amino acid transport system permease protein
MTAGTLGLLGAPPRARRSIAGAVARGVAMCVVLGFVLGLPARSDDLAKYATSAAIFAIVGLSMNVLVGYTGQISLGQQAFVGVGALAAANVVKTGTTAADPFTFVLGMVVACAVAGGTALLLGAIALRITGLYLALVTLVFGSVTADAIFTLNSLNGQGAGVPAYRPTFLAGNYRYYLFALVVVALVIYVDVWLTRTKAGRGLIALKENELVAQAFGVNVLGYKLLGFALSGAIAGLAGGVFAFWNQAFSEKDFTSLAGFNKALVFIVMVVVGGLGNRVGVIAASVFFALIDPMLGWVFGQAGWINYYTDHKYYISSMIGAALLLQTVIFNPGGLGQALRPITRWMSGRPFSLHDPDDAHGGGAEASSVRA